MPAVHVSHSLLFCPLTSSPADRVLVFYPMLASLTIFCNILQSPLNSQAKDDAELLQLVPGLIRSMCSRRLSLNEIMHVEPIEEFVVELARLANCAMIRAHPGMGVLES